MLYWITSPLISQVTTYVALAVVVILLAIIVGAPLGADGALALVDRATWFSAQPLALQIALVFVVGDFGRFTCRPACRACSEFATTSPTASSAR